MGEDEDDITSIPLSRKTRDRLRTFGMKDESWDALLNRFMDEREKG